MKNSIKCFAALALFSAVSIAPLKKMTASFATPARGVVLSVKNTYTTTTSRVVEPTRHAENTMDDDDEKLLLLQKRRDDVDDDSSENDSDTALDTTNKADEQASSSSQQLASQKQPLALNASTAPTSMMIRSNVHRTHPFLNKSLQENVFAAALGFNITHDPVAQSDGLGSHLHLGALDADGNPGFVYNVTLLQHNPPPFDDANLASYCNTSELAYTALQDLEILSSQSSNNNSHRRRPIRLLCAVYSAEQYHATKIAAIRETWGPQCDGFFVASNATHAAYDAVNVQRVGGGERYQNMWNKVQATWGYIYDHYYNSFDWFHLGGDDMWLVVENLRNYLNSDEIWVAQTGGHYQDEVPNNMQFPLFLGQTVAYQGKAKMLYNTGGPGYTLNKAALKLLVTEILPQKDSQKVAPFEDRLIAMAFKNYAPNPVLPYPTRDEELRHRYNTFGPMRYYKRNIPSWYRTYNRLFPMQYGKKHFSPHAVAFHYVRPWVMRQLHALKYICPKWQEFTADGTTTS